MGGIGFNGKDEVGRVRSKQFVACVKEAKESYLCRKNKSIWTVSVLYDSMAGESRCLYEYITGTGSAYEEPFIREFI